MGGGDRAHSSRAHTTLNEAGNAVTSRRVATRAKVIATNAAVPPSWKQVTPVDS